jgi:hypothetical protein
MTALMLSSPAYAAVEAAASTALCAALALFNLGALAPSLLAGLGLLLLLGGAAAAKALLFYTQLWPSFAPDGSQSYRRHLDERDDGRPPPSTAKKAPSPGFTPHRGGSPLNA